MIRSHIALATIALCIAQAAPAHAQDLAAFEQRVTVKVLENGLTVVICERREAPVVSFFTYVNVGSSQEVLGITGLAHMFEHMAFKGTDRIGTTDYSAEKTALEKVEATYAAFDAERRREVGRDPARVAELEKRWKGALAQADKFVVRNAYTEIIERQGGVGLNAFTSHDETGYLYSFPSNRVELWAYLESERFIRPVLREFYKERDVVMEERRMRTDSQPTGRLMEQFLAAAFTAHPYGTATVGWPSDLRSFSATDAKRFYKRYYVPANTTIAIVGDVRASEVLPIVEKYFLRWKAGPKPEPLRTAEPPQRSERTVVLRERSQPFYLEGYHKPAANHPDDAVYTVIQDLMSSGRTSRLYRALVRDKKIAAFASGYNGFPGRKYPNLFAFFGIPIPGHTPAEIRDAIWAEVERLKKEPVSDEELKMVRRRAKANLIRQMGSNLGLAMQLAIAQARFGNWSEIFRRVQAIEKVSKADIQRIANETFVPSNRTVGIIETLPGPKAGGDR
jgi:predicted Zn-dependent peptidase